MLHLYKRLAMGFAFFTFGFFGLFYQFLLFPAIILFIRNRQKRELIARHIIHRTFYFLIHFWRFLGIISWEVHNIERLKRNGLLVLANHLTLIDVLFLFAFIPNASAIVKAALTKNPFTWGALKAAEYLINDEGNVLIDKCVKELASGSNLIIFPEGTRTPPGQKPKLKRGAMATALAAGINPTLVRIQCVPRGLGKNQPWWDVPEKAMHFTFEVLEDLSVEPFLEQYHSNPPLATRALSRAIEEKLFVYYDYKKADLR